MFVHTAAALTIITVLAKKELEINAFILQSTATAVTSKTNPGSREVAGRTGTHALSCSSGQNQAEERDGDDQRLFWDRALQVCDMNLIPGRIRGSVGMLKQVKMSVRMNHLFSYSATIKHS